MIRRGGDDVEDDGEAVRAAMASCSEVASGGLLPRSRSNRGREGEEIFSWGEVVRLGLAGE